MNYFLLIYICTIVFIDIIIYLLFFRKQGSSSRSNQKQIILNFFGHQTIDQKTELHDDGVSVVKEPSTETVWGKRLFAVILVIFEFSLPLFYPKLVTNNAAKSVDGSIIMSSYTPTPAPKGYVKIKDEGIGPANFRLAPKMMGVYKDDWIWEIPVNTILPYYDQVRNDNEGSNWFYVKFRDVMGYVNAGLVIIVDP